MALNGERDRQPVRITVPQTRYHAAAECGRRDGPPHPGSGPERRSSSTSQSRRRSLTGLNAMIAHAIQGKDIERSGTVPAEHVHDAALVCVRRQRGRADHHDAALLCLVPFSVRDGTVTAEWADASWKTYEARMLTRQRLVHCCRSQGKIHVLPSTQSGAFHEDWRWAHAGAGEHRRRRSCLRSPAVREVLATTIFRRPGCARLGGCALSRRPVAFRRPPRRSASTVVSSRRSLAQPRAEPRRAPPRRCPSRA
jgi:hypothetical protein